MFTVALLDQTHFQLTSEHLLHETAETSTVQFDWSACVVFFDEFHGTLDVLSVDIEIVLGFGF